MRTLIYTLSLTLLVLSGCSRESTGSNSLPLSFFVVSDERIEKGRYIDEPGFAKLGYIPAAPDLVITHLSGVRAEIMKEQATMVDKDGKETSTTSRAHPTVSIQLRADDAEKFTSLTARAVGKRVLMMIGETPLFAPRVESPILTQNFMISLGDKTDNKKVVEQLKGLAR